MTPRRLVLLLAALSTAAAFALGAAQIRASAPTYDEAVHLASGYLALKTSLPSLNWRDHPPFAESWDALPLTFMGASILPGVPRGRLYEFADEFLYHNTIDADRMLSAARSWSLATWSLLLALPLAAWACAEAGPAGAAAAALGAAFCPPLYSNAAVTTTDSAAAVLFFLVFFILSRRPRRRLHWAAAGACAGLALASKFSMVAAPAAAVVLLFAEARLEPARRPRPADAALAGAALLAALSAATFGRLGLFWDGLTGTLTRLDAGRASFLLGRYSMTGFALYFPVALAVKTPVPLLLGAAAWAALCLRRPTVDRLWVAGPPAAFFAAACLSKTDIGVRHILPVYPFLVLAAGLAAAEAWKKGAAWRAGVGALALWLAVGAVRCAPDSLAYFNELAGGPDGGRRVLADSNLDWGQGLKALGQELRRRGEPVVFLSYFGVADPSYYGIRYFPFAWYTNVLRRQAALPAPGQPVWLAVSDTNYDGVYFSDHALFGWLDPAKAVARPGRSMLLFDLTKDAPARRKLAAVLAEAGAPPQAQAAALGEAVTSPRSPVTVR